MIVEVKELIQSKTAFEESRDKETEKQIKSTLKTLTATEEALSEEKEKNRRLQKQVKNKEHNFIFK